MQPASGADTTDLDLVTVARFDTSAKAQIALNRLTEEGVRGVVTDGLVVDTDWALTSAVGAVKLQVPAAEANRAAGILAERLDPSELDAAAGDSTPSGDEVDEPPNRREADAERAWRAAIFGLLLWPLWLYGFWVLIKVFVSDEPMRPHYRWRGWFAAVVIVPAVLLFCLLLRALLTPAAGA